MKPADLQEFTGGFAPEARGDALRWVGGNMSVETAEDGPGILEAAQSRIFGPFFNTEDTGLAPGLGQDIDYIIVVRHHSSVIHVISNLGDTRFRR